MEAVLLLLVLSALSALVAWVVALASCAISKFGRMQETFVLLGITILMIATMSSRLFLQEVGARAFVATHLARLTELTDQLRRSYELRSEPGPLTVEVSKALDPTDASRTIEESGFLVAEVTSRYVAVARSGFRGSFVGLVRSANAGPSLGVGDFIFSNRIVRMEPVREGWYLVVTR